MELRVVGAGLGRTGTTSLKAALERLLGGRCYHMIECFGHPEHVPVWHAAATDPTAADLDAALGDYVAAVDWPAAGFWRQLADANPDALILLSTRDSAETWWRSARSTIFGRLADEPMPDEADEWLAMWNAVAGATFTPDWLDADAAMAAYERHNATVRAEADPSRLLEWQPGDGWEPLCERLGVPVPDEPFPRLNTTEDWVNRSST